MRLLLHYCEIMSYYTYPMPVKALNDIYETSQEFINKALEKDCPKVLAAWRVVKCLLYTVETEGALALEDKLMDGTIKRIGAPNYDFLVQIIIACIELYDRGLILDMMVNDYHVNGYGDVDSACMFFYMVGVLECTDRTPEWKLRRTAKEMMQNNLLLLPIEYRQEFAVCSGIICNGVRCEALFPWKELVAGGGTSEVKRGIPWGISQEEFDREEDMKIAVLQQTKNIVDEYFLQMQNAVSSVYKLSEGAFNEGLTFVEEYEKALRKTGTEEKLLLCDAIQMLYGYESDLRSRMIEAYEKMERDAGKDWIRFVYMDAAAMISIGLKPQIIRDVCVGMLPSGYRKR